MTLVHDDDVVETLLAKRAHHAFGDAVSDPASHSTPGTLPRSGRVSKLFSTPAIRSRNTTESVKTMIVVIGGQAIRRARGLGELAQQRREGSGRVAGIGTAVGEPVRIEDANR